MELAITPFVGVGPIRFGMSRREVRSILASAFREFRKTPASKPTTDDFTDLDLHVFYDENNYCKAVEIFSPANPTLHGQTLIREPFNKVLKSLQQVDKEIQIVDSGLRSRKLGIALYAPNADRVVDDPVQSVYVFRKGVFGT